MSLFNNMSNNASKFMPASDLAALGTVALEVGIVASLFKFGTMDSTTPAQASEAQAQQDQRQAAAMLEDARTKEAQADEDRRRASFSQGPSF